MCVPGVFHLLGATRKNPLITAYFLSPNTKLFSRFNTIGIQATAQMAADKEAVDLSRVHIHESNEIIVYYVVKHIYTTRIPTIS